MLTSHRVGHFRGKLITLAILMTTDKLNIYIHLFFCKSRLTILALDFKHQHTLQKLTLKLSKILIFLD